MDENGQPKTRKKDKTAGQKRKKHNSNFHANAAKRREMVSKLKLRYGWNSRLIQEELAKYEDLNNPATGKPYTSAVIRLDLQALEKEWREQAAINMAELKNLQLASIREARMGAWQIGDISNVLKALDAEAVLLGITKKDKAKDADEDDKSAIPVIQVILTHEQDNTATPTPQAE